MKDFGMSRAGTLRSELKYLHQGGHFWVDDCPYFPRWIMLVPWRVPGAPTTAGREQPRSDAGFFTTLQGKVEKRFSRTAMRYFKSWFLLDIVIAPWHCIFLLGRVFPRPIAPAGWEFPPKMVVKSNGNPYRKIQLEDFFVIWPQTWHLPKLWTQTKPYLFGMLNVDTWVCWELCKAACFGPKWKVQRFGYPVLQTVFIRSWDLNPLSITHIGSMGLVYVYLPTFTIHASQM